MPPRTATEHDLPFSQLAAARFEQLCAGLLKAEGYREVRHLGAGGGDEGCDVAAVDPQGRRVVVQCKRVQALRPRKAAQEVTKVLGLPEEERPAVYWLVATCAISLETQREVRKKAGEAFETWFWGSTELDLSLRRHPALVERFFGVLGDPRPYWNAPSRHPYFAGREGLLAALAERLEGQGTVALTQALTGLGGIGKTQIAIEYCHRFGQRYRVCSGPPPPTPGS